MHIDSAWFRRAAVRLSVTLGAAFVMLTPSVVAAQTASPVVFDARADFQLSPNQANPTGPWSYRETKRDGTRPLLTHFTSSLSGVPGIEAWTDDKAYLSWPWVPAVWFNNTGGNYSYLPADGLFVHPSVNHAIVVRWRSPSAGSISIDMTLTDSDAGGGNGVRWSIAKFRHDPVAAGTMANGGTAQASVAQMHVRAGDRIDLRIGANHEQGWDTTQVELRVTLSTN